MKNKRIVSRLAPKAPSQAAQRDDTETYSYSIQDRTINHSNMSNVMEDVRKSHQSNNLMEQASSPMKYLDTPADDAQDADQDWFFLNRNLELNNNVWLGKPLDRPTKTSGSKKEEKNDDLDERLLEDDDDCFGRLNNINSKSVRHYKNPQLLNSNRTISNEESEYFDAQQLLSDQDVHVNGSMIGDYKIEKTLGQGTFGKVKQGIHVHTGQRVAIKILDKWKIDDINDIERVAREIHILKIVKHPHIIQLYEIIETKNRLFLIMEHCCNGELFNYITSKMRLKENEACRLFQQLISGIEYLGELGIAHRDIKPENLLLDEQKNLKIVDFGLSNTFKANEKLVTACGSPCYAAPELIKGLEYVGPKADIWSAGVVLYCLVCGHLPFEDQNTQSLYQKILSAEYHFTCMLSEDVKNLIEQILVPEPGLRYGLKQIKQNTWFKHYKPSNEEIELLEEAADKKEVKVHKRILKEMKRQCADISMDYVRCSLHANLKNRRTAHYFLLMKKKMMLSESLSSLNSALDLKQERSARRGGGAHQDMFKKIVPAARQVRDIRSIPAAPRHNYGNVEHLKGQNAKYFADQIIKTHQMNMQEMVDVTLVDQAAAVRQQPVQPKNILQESPYLSHNGSSVLPNDIFQGNETSEQSHRMLANQQHVQMNKDRQILTSAQKKNEAQIRKMGQIQQRQVISGRNNVGRRDAPEVPKYSYTDYNTINFNDHGLEHLESAHNSKRHLNGRNGASANSPPSRSATKRQTRRSDNRGNSFRSRRSEDQRKESSQKLNKQQSSKFDKSLKYLNENKKGDKDSSSHVAANSTNKTSTSFIGEKARAKKPYQVSRHARAESIKFQTNGMNTGQKTSMAQSNEKHSNQRKQRKLFKEIFDNSQMASKVNIDKSSKHSKLSFTQGGHQTIQNNPMQHQKIGGATLRVSQGTIRKGLRAGVKQIRTDNQNNAKPVILTTKSKLKRSLLDFTNTTNLKQNPKNSINFENTSSIKNNTSSIGYMQDMARNNSQRRANATQSSAIRATPLNAQQQVVGTKKINMEMSINQKSSLPSKNFRSSMQGEKITSVSKNTRNSKKQTHVRANTSINNYSTTQQQMNSMLGQTDSFYSAIANKTKGLTQYQSQRSPDVLRERASIDITDRIRASQNNSSLAMTNIKDGPIPEQHNQNNEMTGSFDIQQLNEQFMKDQLNITNSLIISNSQILLQDLGNGNIRPIPFTQAMSTLQQSGVNQDSEMTNTKRKMLNSTIEQGRSGPDRSKNNSVTLDTSKKNGTNNTLHMKYGSYSRFEDKKSNAFSSQLSVPKRSMVARNNYSSQQSQGGTSSGVNSRQQRRKTAQSTRFNTLVTANEKMNPSHHRNRTATQNTNMKSMTQSINIDSYEQIMENTQKVGSQKAKLSMTNRQGSQPNHKNTHMNNWIAENYSQLNNYAGNQMMANDWNQSAYIKSQISQQVLQDQAELQRPPQTHQRIPIQSNNKHVVSKSIVDRKFIGQDRLPVQANGFNRHERMTSTQSATMKIREASATNRQDSIKGSRNFGGTMQQPRQLVSRHNSSMIVQADDNDSFGMQDAANFVPRVAFGQQVTLQHDINQISLSKQQLPMKGKRRAIGNKSINMHDATQQLTKKLQQQKACQTIEQNIQQISNRINQIKCSDRSADTRNDSNRRTLNFMKQSNRPPVPMNAQDMDHKILKNNYLNSSIDHQQYGHSSTSGTGTIMTEKMAQPQSDNWMSNTISVDLNQGGKQKQKTKQRTNRMLRLKKSQISEY